MLIFSLNHYIISVNHIKANLWFNTHRINLEAQHLEKIWNDRCPDCKGRHKSIELMQQGGVTNFIAGNQGLNFYIQTSLS